MMRDPAKERARHARYRSKNREMLQVKAAAYRVKNPEYDRTYYMDVRRPKDVRSMIQDVRQQLKEVQREKARLLVSLQSKARHTEARER
jgi:hypothetical protein